MFKISEVKKNKEKITYKISFKEFNSMDLNDFIPKHAIRKTIDISYVASKELLIIDYLTSLEVKEFYKGGLNGK